MASTAVTHFISPQIIHVDNLNAKVESINDFAAIPVHAIYHTDTKLRIKCVNTTPQLDEATYQIQDLSGNVLDATDLQTIFEDIIPKMHHAEVSGNQIVEDSLIGVNLSFINNSLTQMLRNSTVENGLNFNIKNEIFKSISSYMTNHTTVSLAGSILDIDENQSTHIQLNTPTFIANELKRFETVALDVSGDDTKSYLNAFVELNNANEVFGDSTIQKLIFIIASDVSVTNDVSSATGLSADYVSAIDTISKRNVFSDELGDPLVQEDQTQLNGKWYAALCFDIGTPGPITLATIEDGFIKSATVRVRDAVTLETKAILLSNDTGDIKIPQSFGLVILDVIESESGIKAIDISTDEPFTGTYSAISDSSTSSSIAITPLTSLVSTSIISDIEESVSTGTPKTLSEISTLKSTKLSQVATAFGVSSADLEVSPIKSTNTATAKIAMQISIIEKMVSSVSSESGVNKKKSTKNFMKSLMARIESKSGGTLDLTNSTELNAVVDSTSTRSGITIESTKLAKLKSGVKNFSDAVSNITVDGVVGLEKLAKINKVATEASNAGGNQLDTILNKNVSEIESDASSATIGTVQIPPSAEEIAAADSFSWADLAGNWIITDNYFSDKRRNDQTATIVNNGATATIVVDGELSNTWTTLGYNGEANQWLNSPDDKMAWSYDVANDQIRWWHYPKGTALYFLFSRIPEPEPTTALDTTGKVYVTYEFTNTDTASYTRSDTSTVQLMYYSPSDEIPTWVLENITDNVTSTGTGKSLTGLIDGKSYRVTMYLNGQSSGGDGGFNITHNGSTFMSYGSNPPYLNETTIIKDFGTMPLEGPYMLAYFAGSFDANIGIPVITGLHSTTGQYMFRQTFRVTNTSKTIPRISEWDVTNLRSLLKAFGNTWLGEVDLTNWKIPNVTNLNEAFSGNSKSPDFNPIGVSGWDVSHVTDFSLCFYGTDLVGGPSPLIDITNWDTSSAVNMHQMLFRCNSFNQDIGSWNVSNVTNFKDMFSITVGTGVFNQDLSSWNVSNGTNFTTMFFNQVQFNGNLTNWDFSKSTAHTMSGFLKNATSFNGDVTGWITPQFLVSTFHNCSAFEGNGVSSWNISNTTVLQNVFLNCTIFNADISSWNVSHVTSMHGLFNGASAFNQDIGGWDVSNVTDMYGLFNGASAFNQDISSWNPTSATRLDYMFQNAETFDYNMDAFIAIAEANNTVSMVDMFTGATAYNTP